MREILILIHIAINYLFIDKVNTKIVNISYQFFLFYLLLKIIHFFSFIFENLIDKNYIHINVGFLNHK
jgi:hypothetical protein